MLQITAVQDGIMIAGQSLKFSTLSTLIKKLHVIGQNMVEWRTADGGKELQNL